MKNKKSRASTKTNAMLTTDEFIRLHTPEDTGPFLTQDETSHFASQHATDSKTAKSILQELNGIQNMTEKRERDPYLLMCYIGYCLDESKKSHDPERSFQKILGEIESNWTCREIEEFFNIVLCLQPQGENERILLLSLYDRLRGDMNRLMGAACAIGYKDGKHSHGDYSASETSAIDFGESLWDKTIAQLRSELPNEISSKLNAVMSVKTMMQKLAEQQLEAVTKAAEIASRKGASEGAHKGAALAVPKAVREAFYQERLAEKDDIGAKAHEPKSRGTKGGRKRIYDPTGVQVAAVIALMDECRKKGKPKVSALAYSQAMLRNPPAGVECPYTTAKALDNAVRNKLGDDYMPLLKK